MIEVFATPDFDHWLQNLKDRQARLQIAERIDRLRYGNPGDSKAIGNGILELRLMYGPGYRVYYTKLGNRLLLLLCGGDKASQQKDIAKARQLAAKWQPLKEEDENVE